MNLDHVRIVLVRPTHPGNIGATARAMRNMGLSRLMLVEPQDFPSDTAAARAAGADDVLTSAEVFAINMYSYLYLFIKMANFYYCFYASDDSSCFGGSGGSGRETVICVISFGDMFSI